MGWVEQKPLAMYQGRCLPVLSVWLSTFGVPRLLYPVLAFAALPHRFCALFFCPKISFIGSNTLDWWPGTDAGMSSLLVRRDGQRSCCPPHSLPLQLALPFACWPNTQVAEYF